MTQAASKAKARTPGRAPKIDWQAALAQHDRWLRKVVYCRLPENLTIVITKQGSQPAKVAVSRGDAKWDVTEEQLDKLPDDVRPHIERMLGHYAVGFGRPWTWDLIPELKPRESPRGPAGPAQPGATLQKQLDQMRLQVEELRKSLDALKAGQGAEESPPPAIEPPKNEPKKR